MSTLTSRPSPRRKRTRWGDVDGRRRDIVAATRYFIEQRGKADVNMREVARRAGVSPGTLYVYFGTKEEIFLTAYAARVDELAATAEQICSDAKSFDDLFARFADAYLAFYREYGQFFNLWSLLADPAALAQLPAPLTERLRAQVFHIFGLAEARARELAANEKRRIRSHPLAVPFVWVVLGGLAEHFIGPKSRAVPYEWDEMVRFAARTLRDGLVE